MASSKRSRVRARKRSQPRLVRRPANETVTVQTGSKWLTPRQAAQRLGMSERNLGRNRDDLPPGTVLRTPGGQYRYRPDGIEAHLQGSLVPASQASPELRNRRERLEQLKSDCEELRLERDLRKLKDAVAQEQDERAASEETHRQDAIQERELIWREQTQRDREAQQRQRHSEWLNSSVDFALDLLPPDVPEDVRLQICAQIKEALAELTPEDPFSLAETLVRVTVEKTLAPYREAQGHAQRQKWLGDQKIQAWRELTSGWRFEWRPGRELRSQLDRQVEQAMGGLGSSSSWTDLRDARASAIEHISAPYQQLAKAGERTRRIERTIEGALRHVGPFLDDLRRKRFLSVDSSSTALLAELLLPKVRAFLECKGEREFSAFEAEKLVENFILQDQKLV
jgi:hypothetical protein